MQATEAGCTFRQSPCDLHTAALTVGVSAGVDLMVNSVMIYAGEAIARPRRASLKAAAIILHTLSLLAEGVIMATVLAVPSTGSDQDKASQGVSNILFIVISCAMTIFSFAANIVGARAMLQHTARVLHDVARRASGASGALSAQLRARWKLELGITPAPPIATAVEESRPKDHPHGHGCVGMEA
jgi:hypothetical protein